MKTALFKSCCNSILTLAFVAGGIPAQPEAFANTLINTTAYGRYYTQMPVEGNPKALVILVDFQDETFRTENPYEYYFKLFNDTGKRENGSSGSVVEWFTHNSNGKFTPRFDIFGPITLPNSLSYYGGNNSTGRDSHPEEMAIDACRLLDDKIDFSLYDNDCDGELDNVFIYYAGYGEVDSGKEDTVWPHSGDILDIRKDEVFKFDGICLNGYACTSEMDGYNDKVAGMGVFIHEFSHVLGLPDLYHTEYQYAFTPDSWSVMDKGASNDTGNTPCNYSSFELFALGWLEPEIISQSGEYELEQLDGPTKGYVIQTDNPDEIFFIENRQKTGNDSFLPGHGMLVWHIDFNQNAWDTNTVNNDALHQRVDIVEADNLPSNNTRNGDTFPGRKKITEFASWTSPALQDWNGKSLGVDITDITESKTGIVKFQAVCLESRVKSSYGTGSPIIVRNGTLFNSSDCEGMVYDISGCLKGRIGPGMYLRIENPGIYIVKVGTDVVKVRI